MKKQKREEVEGLHRPGEGRSSTSTAPSPRILTPLCPSLLSPVLPRPPSSSAVSIFRAALVDVMGCRLSLPLSSLMSVVGSAVSIFRFLDFSDLMDFRALNRDGRGGFEMAALHWMERHLLTDTARVEWRQSRQKESGVPMSEWCFFTMKDAVWFRQLLSRWRWHNEGSEDTRECWIGHEDAVTVYNPSSIFYFPEPQKRAVREKEPWISAVELTRRLLDRLRQGLCPELRGKDSGRIHSHLFTPTPLLNPLTSIKAVRRWWVSQPVLGPPLLFSVPDEVLVHSILSFIDFYTLMQLRPVSCKFKRSCEQAACQWMNRRFPGGLETIHRIEKEFLNGPRQRGELRVDSMTITSVSCTLPPSSSTLRLGSVSYTSADAVRLLQEVNWASDRDPRLQGECLPWSFMLEARVFDSDGVDRFSFDAQPWAHHFDGGHPHSLRRFRSRESYPLLHFIDIFLALYGHVEGFAKSQRVQWERKRRAATYRM